MGKDCCSPPAVGHETDITSLVPSGEKKSCCQGSCRCDSNDAEPSDTTNSGQKESALEELDDCCSPVDGKCEESQTEKDDDAPECCKGKVGPCCDTSCLDRLATRECELSATTALGLNSCDGATNHKACSQHRLSALDRYGATLQALGCICRALIALGQETCCESRERQSLDGKQCSNKSSARSLRTSLDSCSSSNGFVTKKQVAQNRISSQRSSFETIRTVKKAPSNSSVVSLGLNSELAKDPPIRGKCTKLCCSGNVDTSATVPITKSGRAKPGCSVKSRLKQPAIQTRRSESCCSETPRVEGFPPKANCPGSCCFKDNETDNKSICPDLPLQKANAIVKPLTGGCEGSYRGAAKTRVAQEPHSAGSSGSCCKPPNQDIVKTLVTDCARSCGAEDQPESSQGARADACCSPTKTEHGLEIEKALVPEIVDVESQGTGKEHVILSISGMTCTGCETKLNRTLATVPAIKDLKTSLVLSRAEFNIDLRLGSVEEVVKHLERTTEFKCERVQNKGSSLDLIVPDEPSKFVSQTWPDGVLDMTLLDKQSVRVAFDPKIVGARDLAMKGWNMPIELAPPRGDPSLEAGSKHVRRVGYMTLLSAILTIPVLVMAWAPLPEKEVAYSSASLALATIVQVTIAGPFYPKALKALIFSRVIEMDLLIVLSTSTAYVFSVVSFGYLIAGRPFSTGQFFETSTLLVTLIMVGRWVAALARQRAVESISIRSLQSSTAILVDHDNGTEHEIDARLLQYGDIFKVLPDTKIPTDGTIITGSSEVDESMLTGESRPVEKHPKSVVIAGSINGPGALTVRLNRLPSDNTINAIAAMVDEAKLSKPKLQGLADQVASYFVPAVLALTVITFAIWVAVGMAIRGYDGSEAAIQAITYAITVLIVSCPCAIGLAVPIVIVISSGIAAERGIIFKSADAIEVAHKTSHIVFDKTGTLTRGKLSVTMKNFDNVDQLPLLLGLIENSRHPVPIAVASHLKDGGMMALTVPDAKSLTGKGVETTLNGRKLQAGNSHWLELSENEHVQPMLAQGCTVFCFAIDSVLQAVYGLEDVIRPDATQTIEGLQKRGVSVHVVSGDDDGAVRSVASQLNIPDSNVRSRSSPADKKDYIQKLLATGNDRKEPVVVFCGDGTNDAVALAQATIGVHMNEGTDVAQSAADVVLMRPCLAGILTMMDASRKSVNRIKFNFLWSCVYNTFAVLLAAGAFVKARIPPEYAGLGELVSVLPVIAAAVLLRWSKI